MSETAIATKKPSRVIVNPHIDDALIKLMHEWKVEHKLITEIEFGDRMRVDYSSYELGNLQKSIEQFGGIFSPLMINDKNVLISGGRRYKALIALKWDEPVPCVVVPISAHADHLLLEFAENYHRKDLTPVELSKAIQQMYELSLKLDIKGNQPSTGKNAKKYKQKFIELFAKKHLFTIHQVTSALQIAGYIEEISIDRTKVYEVASAPSMDGAVKVMRSQKGKEQQEIKQKESIQQLLAQEAKIKVEEIKDEEGHTQKVIIEAPKIRVVNADFKSWIYDFYSEGSKNEPFNLIHCDFPFGVKMHTQTHNKARAVSDGMEIVYDDNASVYFDLLDELTANIDTVLAPKGIILFWYSMKFHCETIKSFTEAGLIVHPYPIIWSKKRGTATMDTSFHPLQSYETMLLVYRKGATAYGEGFLSVQDEIPNKSSHAAAKPIDMMHKVFKRYVPPVATRFSFLDPTCGGGNSLLCAKAAGIKNIVGVELNPEYALHAQKRLDEAHALERQSTISIEDLPPEELTPKEV